MAREKEVDVKQLVEQTINELKPGKDEHDKRVRRYDQAYDVYRASEPNPASMEPWQSKLRVRYGMQVIDTAMVNMASGAPRCKVYARTPDYANQAQAFQLVMDYYASQDHLGEKQPVIIQQGLIYGVTAAKNHWLLKETDKIVKGYDDYGNPQVSAETVTLYDGPSLEPWDIYDVWWDPFGRDVDSCAYVVMRSWLSKEQLLSQQCTVDKAHHPNDCDGLYHNVDMLIRSGAQQKQGLTAQDRALGGSQTPQKGLFEVWEVWRDDRLTVIGNQTVMLRDTPNPHWHGRKPVVIAATRPDLFKVQGIPETELVNDLQQAMWTAQNRRMDNANLTVMRGFTYREGGVADPNQLILRPRFRWPVTDHDDIRPVEIQPLPPEAYQEEREMLGQLQYVTGINPYITGATQSGGADQNTATGVNILNEVASRLLRFKAQQIHYGIWQRTFEQWGNDIQQFMDKPLWVRIVGEGGAADYAQVSPQDVVGEYDFVLEGTEDSLSKQQERSDIMGLMNVAAPFIQAGILNPRPLLEKVARAFNIDDPQSLMMPQQPQMAAPVQQGATMQGAPQPMAPQLPGGQPMSGMPAAAIMNGGM